MFMKLQRFFCEEPLSGKNSVVITHDSMVSQFKNVLRFVKGDKVVLFDNSGFDFHCSIENYDNKSVTLNIEKSVRNTILPLKETYLFASIVKKDNFEWIAQKATELGVSYIIPIISERTEKKDINIERIHKIIVEAAEQCGRGTLPVLHDVMTLENALHDYGHIKSIAWHPLSQKFVSQEIVSTIGSYVGPEGGWSPAEEEMFKKHGVHMRSLGPQVLRAETAVIAVISRLVF